MAAAALATFGSPICPVAWMTCRCRLESDTTSSSITPSVPTPAAARYISTGAPRPPGADHQHARVLERRLPGPADLAQHDVARVTLQLLGAQHGCTIVSIR